MALTYGNRKTIKIANPPLEGNDRTYVSRDCVVGSTSIYVVGAIKKFEGDTDWYVMIGNYGEETSEIVSYTDYDDSDGLIYLQIGATQKEHSAGDPVTAIPYNKMMVYGMATETSTPTLVSTIDIDTTYNYTQYNYTGTTYSYFKVRYARGTSEASDYSDTFSVNTFTRQSVKNIIESAIKRARTRIDENYDSVLTMDVMLGLVNDALDYITKKKRKWSFLHKVTSTGSDFLPLTSVSGTEYISNTPTDISEIDYVWLNGKKLDYITRTKYNQLYSLEPGIGEPYYWTMKNNYIYLYPTPNDAYDVTIEYYKDPAVVDSLTDTVNKEFVLPVTSYCAGEAAYIRGNDTLGKRLKAEFNDMVLLLIEEYTGEMQSGDAESMESTSMLDE